MTDADRSHAPVDPLTASSVARAVAALRRSRFVRGDHVAVLGLDGAGQLHIIETKIGSDDMLVFQVLDYLSWVTAHASAIRADRGWPAGDDSVVHIDFVVAPKTGARPDPALGSYTAGQLAALREDVAWRIHLVDDAHAGAPAIHSYRPREVPPPRPGIVATPIF